MYIFSSVSMFSTKQVQFTETSSLISLIELGIKNEHFYKNAEVKRIIIH